MRPDRIEEQSAEINREQCEHRQDDFRWMDRDAKTAKDVDPGKCRLPVDVSDHGRFFRHEQPLFFPSFESSSKLSRANKAESRARGHYSGDADGFKGS